MDRLSEILKRLNMEQFSNGELPKTEEEWEKAKADSYNREEGHLHEKDGYICKLCNNKGNLMEAKEESGSWTLVNYNCKCMKVRRTIRKMEKSGLKNIIRDYTFDKYEATEEWQSTIKASAQKYVQDPSGWFFIGGQVGAGKTHICTAICRELLLAGKSVRYMLWLEDAVKLKGSITDSEEYTKMLDDFKRADVLYIDDLFKTGRGNDGNRLPPTGADIRLAMELLNYRYSEKLPTIISCEYKIGEIVDIDEAIGSRINERAYSAGYAFSLKPDRKKNYRLRGSVEL